MKYARERRELRFKEQPMDLVEWIGARLRSRARTFKGTKRTSAEER